MIAYGRGTQQASTGVVTMRLAGSSDVPTNILALGTAAAGTVYGTVNAVCQPAATTAKSFQVIAYTSAGTFRIEANGVQLAIKDITAG